MAIGAFAGIRIGEMEEGELKTALRRARRLTAESYSNYEKNEKPLVRLFAGIMELSRQQKEWYVYFYAIYERMYLAKRTCDSKAIIRYAEIYYRDSDLYMDENLPKYLNTDMGYLNVWICGFIYGVYMDYCEIDDAKMKLFMSRYEAAALKYGKTFCYYKDEMGMAVLYRNLEMMEHGRRNFERYEKDMTSCYICGHLPMLDYYLMKDSPEQAECLMQDFLNRNIPRKHLWCYQYCEYAQPQLLYAAILRSSLELEKPESFRYFLEKYWLALPRERWRQRGDTGIWYRNLSLYICAIVGNFDDLEYDLGEAKEDLENIKTYTATSKIRVSLMWHCYFELLDRSGVREVPLCLPGDQNAGRVSGQADLEDWEKQDNRIDQGNQDINGTPGQAHGGGEGMVSTLAVSRYMERFADEWGEKFSKSRAEYDYYGWKRAYRECAGLQAMEI